MHMMVQVLKSHELQELIRAEIAAVADRQVGDHVVHIVEVEINDQGSDVHDAAFAPPGSVDDDRVPAQHFVDFPYEKVASDLVYKVNAILGAVDKRMQGGGAWIHFDDAMQSQARGRNRQQALTQFVFVKNNPFTQGNIKDFAFTGNAKRERHSQLNPRPSIEPLRVKNGQIGAAEDTFPDFGNIQAAGIAQRACLAEG